MELLFLLFFVSLAIASAAGLTVDSRDYADWKPTEAGERWRARRTDSPGADRPATPTIVRSRRSAPATAPRRRTAG